MPETYPGTGPTADDAAPLVIAHDVRKRYHIYARPQDRLWQGLFRGRRQFFRDFWALRGVSFDVRRGEIVGIIGRNGSGKSTLLQIVCGTLEPTSGAVSVRGRVAALLELGSGFNPEFTGRENVYLNGTILGLTRAEIDERFDRIAAFADIGAFIEQPVKTYSSGMALRLAFAVIAHVDADVLVIDEALSVGDALFTQKCLRFLRQFREHGAILFVSHDTAAVLSLCQRAVWIDHGVCVRAGVAKDVVEAYVQSNIEIQQKLDATASPQSAKVEERHAPPPAATVSESADTSIGSATAPDAGASSFGAGGVVIQSVEIVSHVRGTATTVVNGGERLSLRITVRARHEVSSAIVGFHFKDRFGQVVFGENTFRTTEGAPVHLRPEDTAVAEFVFPLPLLQPGKYSVDVAVADGTQDQHVQHHWSYDALLVQVLTDRQVFGVLALPGTSVSFARTSAPVAG
ncbi:MAG: ABC transporter ATP-binding protein [Vicinamibacterales bacterium]